MLTIALIEAGTARPAKHPSGWEDAIELYCDEQTKMRITDVRSRKIPWYFLTSTGLLSPGTPIRPKSKPSFPTSGIAVADWHIGVVNDLLSVLETSFHSPVLSEVTIELHAGPNCCHPLKEILELFGLKVIVIKPDAKIEGN